MNKKAVDSARSLYYGLFSKMLVFREDDSRYDGIKEVLEVLAANPMEPNSAEALKELLQYMTSEGYRMLSDEYDDIFHNPENAVVRTTASFYDEGVESGKKRVEVKNFLGKTKIRRDEQNFREPEDSIAFLMTLMHELVELVMSGESSYLTVQHCLFEEVINGLMDCFVPSLYENEKSQAYKSLAVVMNAFLEFERLYFGVGKPKPKEIVDKKTDSCEFISDTEARRRAENRAKRAADSLVKSCAIDDSVFEDEAGVAEL